MSQAGALFAGGLALLSEQMPAVIIIDGQGYDCASTGKLKDSALTSAGWVAVWKRSFWVAKAKFAAAGKPEPVDKMYLTCAGEEWLIDGIKTDPAGGGTLVLGCSAPAQ